MKQFLSVLLLLSVLVTAQAQQNIPTTFFKPRPAEKKALNDFAGMLDDSQQQMLENKLRNFFSETGNPLVIITTASLTDSATGTKYNEKDVAKEYGNRWGIGDKDKDNGIVIFVAKADRKVRIATGKGMEKLLTDDKCQQVLDQKIVPAFKKGNYYLGLSGAVESIQFYLSPQQEAIATPVQQIQQNSHSQQSESYTTAPQQLEEKKISAGTIIGIVFGLLLLGMFIRAIIRRVRGKQEGGFFSKTGYTIKQIGGGIASASSGMLAGSSSGNSSSANYNNRHNRLSSDNDSSVSSKSKNDDDDYRPSFSSSFSSGSSASFGGSSADSSSSSGRSSSGGGSFSSSGASGSW